MHRSHNPEYSTLTSIEALKNYLLSNFLAFFILAILTGLVAIVVLAPFKLAFLNFFFLPVLLAAYYLNLRGTLLGSLFTVTCVFLAAFFAPELFAPEESTPYLLTFLLSWAGFLIAAALVVNTLQENFLGKLTSLLPWLKDVSAGKLLRMTTAELNDYVQNLDGGIDGGTGDVEKIDVAAEKQRIEDALFSTMDPVVAQLLIEKRLRTELRRISIQFCDIQNFTGYSEKNPAEVVITRLNKHLEKMENTLFEYKAHIDKYLGDGIMSEFGAPTHYDQHALLAVVAGIKMQESAARDESSWAMRIGISTGDTITGLIGHRRQAYTAMGDSVNLAARIQEVGRLGKVTVDEATQHDTRRYIRYRRKSILQPEATAPSLLREQLVPMLNALDGDPSNIEHMMNCAQIYLQLDDLLSCLDLVKRALNIDSEHLAAKLLYAEASLKSDQMDDISLRGRQQTLHLYEVEGIVNPLHNQEKIPPLLLQQYEEIVSSLAAYPEDILLPVECIEGYVGHSRVVGFLAYAIADRLNLPDEVKRDVLEAGYLADIGKSIIPHHLLNRRGTLSREEFKSIKGHPAEGVRKLKQLGYTSESVLEMVENHHENYDGSGYPSGKDNAQFSIGARIIAVSEAYDSMTSWRPYRESWERQAALTELEQYSGRGKFDPRVMQELTHLLSPPAISTE
ncbi:MAG TPA: HD domain-containing protein [Gammaproteobacteria bacterium]|nr:HD domain-containing protein [Gammaproteobacteria bacterium]HIL97297.1 HD domain-containing protein [Pseudomonadales bacterium]